MHFGLAMPQGSQQVSLTIAPPASTSLLLCFWPEATAWILILHKKEIPLTKKMLGGALVLMFIEMVTGICLVFSHVLAIVTEQYTSGYPCSIRHCSTKGCGNVDISGSPGPKLGHGTDRRYGHWVRVQLNLRLSALLKSTLLYIAEGSCFNVQRKVRERDLATGDYLLCINYLLMQNTRHQS